MDTVPQGPYANSDKAPLFVQRCRCPLMCPIHGENGPIPGDMKTPAQPWEGVKVTPPGPPPSYLGSPQPPTQQTVVETVPMSPAPVGPDGVVGLPPVPRPAPVVGPEGEWVSVRTTPPAIIPVDIPDAIEQLAGNCISVTEDGEDIVVHQKVEGRDDLTVALHLPFELANCLAQEILNARKRIELTLPETLETTLEAAKKRLGPDMAPLVDLIKKSLHSSG